MKEISPHHRAGDCSTRRSKADRQGGRVFVVRTAGHPEQVSAFAKNVCLISTRSAIYSINNQAVALTHRSRGNRVCEPGSSRCCPQESLWCEDNARSATRFSCPRGCRIGVRSAVRRDEECSSFRNCIFIQSAIQTSMLPRGDAYDPRRPPTTPARRSRVIDSR